MKKGCFIKSVVLLTIATAVILYIVQHKMDTYILKPGRQALTGIFVEKVDDLTKNVKNTPEKDSLKLLIGTYIKDHLSRTKTFSNKMFKDAFDSVKVIIGDSVVNKTELQKFIEFIKQKKLK